MATLSDEDYPFLKNDVSSKRKKKAPKGHAPKTFRFPERPPASEYALEIVGLIVGLITTLFIVFAFPVIFGF